MPHPWKSQNHRMVGVGRDLCGSSSPTLLLKQGLLQQAAQDLVQAGLGYLQRRRLQNLPGQPVPVLHQKICKARLDGALSNLMQLKMSLLMAGGLDWMAWEGPSQPKPFRDSTKTVGGEANPQGCSQGSGTEALVPQNEKKLHKALHLQIELAHLCNITGLQELQKM